MLVIFQNYVTVLNSPGAFSIGRSLRENTLNIAIFELCLWGFWCRGWGGYWSTVLCRMVHCCDSCGISTTTDVEVISPFSWCLVSADISNLYMCTCISQHLPKGVWTVKLDVFFFFRHDYRIYLAPRLYFQIYIHWLGNSCIGLDAGWICRTEVGWDNPSESMMFDLVWASWSPKPFQDTSLFGIYTNYTFHCDWSTHFVVAHGKKTKAFFPRDLSKSLLPHFFGGTVNQSKHGSVWLWLFGLFRQELMKLGEWKAPSEPSEVGVGGGGSNDQTKE